MDDGYSLLACRACLRVTLECFHFEAPIVEDAPCTLKEFYVSSTNLIVNKDDDLPHVLCTECTSELRRFYEFVQKAQESELAYRERLEAIARTKSNDLNEDTGEFFGFAIEGAEEVVVIDDGTQIDGSESMEVEQQQDQNETDDDDDGDYTKDPGLIRFHDFNYKELNEKAAQDLGARKKACSQCKVQFSSKLLLAKHLTEMHGDFEDLCKLCGVQCSSRNKLALHLFSHKDLKTYPCQRCDMQHFTKFGLRIHMTTSHTKRQQTASDATCDICGKHFTNNKGLLTHQSAGCSELNYPCHLCEKRFSKEVHLKHHIMVHEGREPYLRYHAKLGKKHQCEICHKIFNRPSELKFHMLDHEGKKAYNCAYCPKSFKRRNTYRGHLEEIHEKTIDQYDMITPLDKGQDD